MTQTLIEKLKCLTVYYDDQMQCLTVKEDDIRAIIEQAKAESLDNYLNEVHEVRHCDYCHHVGVDDASKDLASCASCGWTGQEPEADICPSCQAENVMSATCPKCNEIYNLVTYVSTSIQQPDIVAELVKALEGMLGATDGVEVNTSRINAHKAINLAKQAGAVK